MRRIAFTARSRKEKIRRAGVVWQIPIAPRNFLPIDFLIDGIVPESVAAAL